MTYKSQRLNILLILTDQHRFDTLGCYAKDNARLRLSGAPICRTPNIDRMAQQGVRFERAYTSTVPCSPSRAALFTGLYPNATKNSSRKCPKVPIDK